MRFVTCVLRIYKRPGLLGFPDVLSANRFLHFRRYSEARLRRMERVVCQVLGWEL